MKFSNSTKLVLTIICMVVCLIAMFLGIWLGAKELNFTGLGEVNYNNVDANVDVFIIGHEKQAEDETSYIFKSLHIDEELQEGSESMLKDVKIKWQKRVEADKVTLNNITVVYAITNTSKHNKYLAIDLPEDFSNNFIAGTQIRRVVSSGIGRLSTDENVFLTDNNQKYKGIELSEGASDIKSDSGIPTGYTYVIKVVYALQELNIDSDSINRFNVTLTSSETSNFKVEGETPTTPQQTV